MWNIEDVIQSYLKDPKFKSNFKDKIKNSVRSNSSEWDHRIMKSSKSILTAVCFRETAIASLESQDSLVYQPIGLYYSMFHISMAMCWINPRVRLEDLKHIQHAKLLRIIESQFVQNHFVPQSFFDVMSKLKELREACNYQFGYQDNLELEVRNAVEESERAFDCAFQFIHQVLNASASLFRVQVGIGDGFGDQILDSYLSKEHKENVFDFLVQNGLSS
ncbi:MAG TPA: hypothetical protein VJ623_02990 [Holophagaceae bacterium]|nr:hypothetical protein [Holophagaceae bacterium]